MTGRILGFLTALMCWAMPAFANPYSDILEVQVLKGWRLPNGDHMAAVQIQLYDGWKTYWRTPGDAGIPPRFDWAGSRNLSAVSVNWPTPRRILQNGKSTIGYAGTLILPITLTPAREGKEIELSGELDIGVCNEVCVPVRLDLTQVLPETGTKPDPRIVAALADQPYSAAKAGVTRVSCRITPIPDGLSLRAEVDLPATGGRETAIVETDNRLVWVAQPKTQRKGGRLVAETELYHVEGNAFAVNRAGLRITVLGQDYAVDIQGCPAG